MTPKKEYSPDTDTKIDDVVDRYRSKIADALDAMTLAEIQQLIDELEGKCTSPAI